MRHRPPPLPTLQVLEVAPRPEAMRCQLSLQLPAGMRLRRLTVHGSFNRLLSTKAASEVFIHTRALSRWACLPACLPSSLLHSKYDGAVC